MIYKNGGSVTFHFDGDDKRLKSKLTEITKTMAKVGVGMTAAITTPIAIVSKKATELAGNLEQSIGGAEAVFDDYFDKIVKKAQESSSKMGTSTNDYLTYANKIGSLMKGSGLETSQAFDLTTKAMERASDVASIMGIDVESAMEAITGAAKGNFTMMDNLGVAMNATNLQAYALSKGIKKSYTAMTQAEKVQLAYNMFLEQTSEYAGNYAKENDTLNGSITTLKAELENLMADLGKTFVPIMIKVVKKVQEAVNWWKQLDGRTKKIILTIAGVLAVVGPVLLVITKVISFIQILVPIITGIINAIKIMTIVIKALFTLLTANPIGIIITAIVGLIAGIILLYKKCEWFRNIVHQIGEVLKNIVSSIVDHVKKRFEIVKLAIQLFIALIKAFVNKVRNDFNTLKNIVTSVFSKVVSVIKSVPGKIASIPKQIVEKFKSAITNIKDVGKNIVKGLWQGAKDMKDYVVNRFKGLGKSILGGMKKALGIKSPSKEFAIIGRFSMLGYTEGLEQMQPELNKAINGMFNLSPNVTGTMNNRLSPNVNVSVVNNLETDPLGQVVSKIKTFSGGAKNDYNYGYGG